MQTTAENIRTASNKNLRSYAWTVVQGLLPACGLMHPSTGNAAKGRQGQYLLLRCELTDTAHT